MLIGVRFIISYLLFVGIVGFFALWVTKTMFPGVYATLPFLSPSASEVSVVGPSDVSRITIIEEETSISSDARLVRAQEFLESGFFSEAKKNIDQVLEEDPYNTFAYKILIDIHEQRRDFSEAEKVAREYLLRYPNDNAIKLKRGIILLKKGSTSQALTAFSTLPDTSAERFFYEAMIHSFDGDHTLAKEKWGLTQQVSTLRNHSSQFLQVYQEFDLFPDGTDHHLSALLSKVYNDLGFYQMTIQNLRMTLEQRPTYRDAWLLVGYSYLSLGKFTSAQRALEKAVSLDPSKAESVYFLGLAYAELGNYLEASAQLKNAISNGYTPKKEVQQKLAQVYVRDQKYSEAIEVYDQMLEEGSESVDEFVQPVFIALSHLGSPEMALDFADRSVLRYPNQAMSYNLKGWVMHEKGDFDASEEALQKAMSLDSGMAAVFLNMGHLRKKQGRLVEALDMYQKAFDMDQFGAIGNLAVQSYNDLLPQVNQ